MTELSFPRGGHSAQAKTSSNQKKRASSDFLFGTTETPDSSSPSKKHKKTDTSSTAESLKKKSLLPLGGGAVVKPGKGEIYIESLGFSKLEKGLQMLACVKEVHEDLAIFSLPNQWTAFMLATEDREKNEVPCNVALRVGQFLAVEIVKAVQESTPSGPRRRIQVTCDPKFLNPRDDSIHAAGSIVRCRVQSVEDHGILMDLGLKRQGFLPFGNIHQDYSLEDDEDVDTTNSSEKIRMIEGGLLDCIVEGGHKGEKVVKLTLPSRKNFVKHFLPSTHIPTLKNLRPGMLVHAVVEEIAKNGLCVTFAGGAFRGAIEHQHLGVYYVPENRNESTEWKKVFDTNRYLSARIIAVDPATKIVRLSLLSHILELSVPVVAAPVGALIERAKVIRLDPGLGALLALPSKRPGTSTSLFKPITDDEDFLQAMAVQAVYVHISKAMDESSKGKVNENEFAKKFAPSTEHSVRVLGTSNFIEGILSGAAAESVVNAHVLTHADITPGNVYKQVPIVTHLKNGSLMVDFGNGIRGIVPSVHLFDQVAQSEFRDKIQKTKFAVGSRIDVRVLTVDENQKRCVLTAKKSLVKAKTIISSYEDARVGMRTLGFVSKIDNNGIFVTFFNGVFGRVSARSLTVDLGINDHRVHFSIGDSVECCVLNKRPKVFHKDKGMVNAGQDDDEFTRWELTLSLRPNSGDQVVTDEELRAASSQQIVELDFGKVLPERCMRIKALVKSQEKKNHFVPGYAIVSIKTKYLFHSAGDFRGLPQIECKLPYDQLLDTYAEDDVQNAASLDKIAESMLVVGKKVNRKSIILRDPKKPLSEYFSGLGKLVQLSLRPTFVSILESKSGNVSSMPVPDSVLAIGERVTGFVAQIDSRYGSFIRFLNGLTGLVPKSRGGLSTKLFSTVEVHVLGIDETKSPRQILLSLAKSDVSAKDRSKVSSFQKGDLIEKAEITDISFHRLTLKPCDSSLDVKGYKFQLHCTLARSVPPMVPDLSMKGRGQDVTKHHPFGSLKVGDKLSKLFVYRVRQKGKTEALVDLTQIEQIPDFQGLLHTTEPTEVKAIISSHSKSGVYVQIDPDNSTFVPKLDMTGEWDVFQNIEAHFPVGSCFPFTVLPKTQKGIQRDNPVLRLSRMYPISSPELGKRIIGKINRQRDPRRPASVVVDLPGGFWATCCVTELLDESEWIDMPLGNHNTSGQKEKLRTESSKSGNVKFGLFPHGKFVQGIIISEKKGSPDKFEVSLRKSRLKGSDTKPTDFKEGSPVQAYVVATTKDGCFLRLNRYTEGRVLLKDLSDGFLPNPAEAFPPGRLVAGILKGVHSVGSESNPRFNADVDLRDSTLLKTQSAKLSFEEISVGDKYKGRVTRIEDYGVFVRIEESNVSGLVHKSECSDQFVKSLSSLFSLGDLVKVVVLKKDEATKRLGFSMKPSLFEDEDSVEEDAEMDIRETPDDSLSGEGENPTNDEEASTSSEDTSDSEDSEDTESVDSTRNDNPMVIEEDLGFDWGGERLRAENQDDQDTDSESESEVSLEDNPDQASGHNSRRKHAKKRLEEEEIGRRELALASGMADDNPESAGDFERLLTSEPNSSELWIRYMAFYLSLANVPAAREVAERSFQTIDFREESELLNVWSALLALEVKYGSDDSLESTLLRASQHNNPKHVHLRLFEILHKEGKNSPKLLSDAESLCSRMCKKFRSKKTVWTTHIEFLLSEGRDNEALNLSKRALQSLPDYKHLPFLSKFAQMLYAFGSAERARTVFDGLLEKNKKRLDLFFVYVDKETKFGSIKTARELFVRAASSRKDKDDSLLRLSDKQMKNLFKKWYSFEEVNGDDDARDAVKEAAKAYVESS